MRRSAFRRRPADVVAIVAGVVVFVPCALVASPGTVGSVERAVFRAVNRMPDALFVLAMALQFLGVLVVGPIVAAAALVLRRWRLALAAALVTVGKLAVERQIWGLVTRARPGASTPGAIVRGSTPAVGQAFVSGHVILVTGLAWVLVPYLRGRWRALPWVIVAGVAWARMYLGAHNPLDVLGGAAIGVALGGLVNLVVGVPTEPRR